MKILFILLVALLSSLSLEAQHTYKSDAYKISFTAPKKMEFFDDASAAMIGWTNKDYTLYVQSVPIAQESKKFVKNLENGAGEIAKDLEFKNVMGVGKIPDIENSYYISGNYVDEEENIPVYVGAILNHTTQMAHEVVLYCNNQDKVEGEKIMKSFKLLK